MDKLPLLQFETNHMKKEYEYEKEGYYLKFREGAEGLLVTACGGQAICVQVPEQLEGIPVTGISKKAFLSRKNIKELLLPSTITSIEDWAFAYCGKLERVQMPGNVAKIGKAIFANCGALQQITCLKDNNLHEWSEDVSYLLATAVREMDAYYLLDIRTSGTEEWLSKWDSKLLKVMQEDDNEGYLKQILCGEEDYGSTDLEAFLSEKRKKKVRLSMLRLQHNQGLSEEIKEYLKGYLQTHTKGCEQEETWQVLLNEHCFRKESWDLFVELGCATSENMEGLLEDIGEEYPQMKAYFLRYKAKKLGYEDFFAGLEL